MTHILLASQPMVISPPNGTSQLPLVEIDKTKVQTKHKSILLPKAQRQAAECSYGASDQAPLPFSAWEFFHAAKKTELATSFTPSFADQRAFAFALEHEDTFLWNPTNFRKRDSTVFSLEDFAETGLAGRVGEAIAYLTMVHWGYAFWDRCATVWARAARNANITHADQLKVAHYISSLVASGKPQKEPDFIFEKHSGDVALMEAKGGFVEPGNDYPYTKKILNQSLKQLGAWSSVIAPTPAKSYGIATLLREENDSHGDPSLIAYVDPPAAGNPDIDPVEYRPDAIRRGNFGAWLIGMGFRNSGLALADRREIDTATVELPVITLNGVDFALSIQGWRVNRHLFAPFSWWPFDLWHVPLLHRYEFLRDIGVTGIYALGLEIGTLSAVSAALVNPASNSMMDLPICDFGRQSVMQGQDGFYGSVFPDGSLLGIVSSRDLDREMRTETFKL